MNGQVFSSIFNSTDKGNIVKALFPLTDESLHPSFGVVNFFFDVDAIDSETGTRTCSFAFFGLSFTLLQRSLFHNSIWSYMVKKSVQVIVLSVLFYLDVYFYLLVRVSYFVSSKFLTAMYPHNYS